MKHRDHDGDGADGAHAAHAVARLERALYGFNPFRAKVQYTGPGRSLCSALYSGVDAE